LLRLNRERRQLIENTETEKQALIEHETEKRLIKRNTRQREGAD
jgi:hypothetical protein